MESQLATHHFGHFYLTQLLLDLLRNSQKGRVISLTSRLTAQPLSTATFLATLSQ
jgi:NAD(P)-dependent dehydrogenase (short-subunit alcohol dehydrogenase family)